jgi:hypothetical protein
VILLAKLILLKPGKDVGEKHCRRKDGRKCAEKHNNRHRMFAQTVENKDASNEPVSISLFSPETHKR